MTSETMVKKTVVAAHSQAVVAAYVVHSVHRRVPNRVTGGMVDGVPVARTPMPATVTVRHAEPAQDGAVSIS